ncbi:MAG: DUF2585 domain-containing protein [Hyphomicrobiales bacterium]
MNSMISRKIIIGAGIIIAMAIILLLMGRVPICECGTIKLWHGDAFSSESSQHIADWYTPSHMLHGMLFYLGLWAVWRNGAIGDRAIAAIILEASWEIAENTNFIIQRYREVTISLDYFGDSVLNSVSDVFAMLAGFYLARRLPVPVTIVLALTFEAVAMWVIRDGLALNILMLLWPIDAVKDWQMDG